MADWKSRAHIVEDVVFFRYISADTEPTFEEVYVWDLDKTYLDTSFGTARELWRTIVEKAFQKKNVAGTGSLVRALKSAWQDERGQKAFPIYFITASPPQMEAKIKDKLELDEILPLGAFYKDNLRNIKPSRMWRLTKQVGFKLQALLQLRLRLRADVKQVLWGDDSESDAIIYSLYSDICARRWPERDLLSILRALHVVGEQVDVILDLQSQIPISDPVEKIYINLATDTDPEYYLKFGRRLIATYNTFQTALDLMQDHRLPVELVIKVAQDMTMNFGYTREQLESSLDNLVRRELLSDVALEAVLPDLKLANLISNDFKPSLEPKKISNQEGPRVYSLEGSDEPWVPDHIEYLNEIR